MRKDEVKIIKDLFTKVYDINLKVVNAKKNFQELKGVTDPEKKGKL